ncbi:MAG TPA: hypothetical protein VN365_05555 [Candidatus Thermoplasmatota archaeon]|nr:hypothetical protein [Candidatus Thermoplasmatota archaeon]
MKRKWIAIGIIFLFVCVAFGGCTLENTLRPKPNINVVSTRFNTSFFSGKDLCVLIDVTVTNYGDDGIANVWAELKQDGNTYTQKKVVILDYRQNWELHFSFCNISSVRGYTYQAWVENR